MKQFFYIFLWTLWSFESLFSTEFDNPFNKHEGGKIDKLKVCGERCSGTNFLMHLLHFNFPSLKHSDLLEFGQKHFLWWYGTPLDAQKLKKLKYQKNAVTLSGTQNCLFVVVVRNPYDWLRSFYLAPHCVHEDLLSEDFYHFLTSEWKLKNTYPKLDGQYNEIDNYNPWTKKPFTNVLELRKYKLLNYLTLSTKVNNYIIVKYENVRDNPKKFINFIAKFFHLRKNKEFIPVDTYKGSHLPYKPQIYFSFQERELEFINSQIDWEVEKALGFFKATKSNNTKHLNL